MKIKIKLILSFLFIVLIFGIAMTYNEYMDQKTAHENQIKLYEERGVAIAKVLDNFIDSEDQLKTPEYAESIVQETIASDIGIVEFSILTKSPPEKNYESGMWFLATTEDGRQGTEGDPQDAKAMLEDKYNVIWVEEDDHEKVMEVSTPIHDVNGKPIGIAGIIFSVKKLDSLMVVKNPLLITMIVAIIAIIIGIILADRIAKPVKQLKESTDKLTNGDFNVNLPEVNSNDEISDLTASIEMLMVALKTEKQKNNPDNKVKNDQQR